MANPADLQLPMKKNLQNLIDLINRIDLRVLIFLVIFLSTFSFRLNENEEEYFVFAKAFANPHWIPGALSIRDAPGTRIIFDSVVGWLLGYASFEQVAVLGRALCALLFAFPLARIFRKLQFTNLEGIFVLQLICAMVHQSFFGKEWMFLSFETKVLSYVFVFYSIYYLLSDRNRLAVFFAGLAVYFHVLVGGWYLIALFLYFVAARVPWRVVLSSALILALLLTPLGYYLAGTYLLDNPNVIDGTQVSWVYVYVRNPHHLDVLRQLRQIGSSAQIGVALSAAAAWLCVNTFLKNKSPELRKLSLLALAIFCQQLLSIVAAMFDTGGVFLKFYPYRTSSLSLFLTLLILMLLYKEAAGGQRVPATSLGHSGAGRSGPSAVVTVMVAGLALGLASKVCVNAVDSYAVVFPSVRQTAKISLYQWIKTNTPPDAVILDLNDRPRDNLDFIRKTDRDSFSVYKFVPTTNRLIYEWYQRALEKDRVAKNISVLPEVKSKYKINYVLSTKPLTHENLRPVYQNEFYFLYAS